MVGVDGLGQDLAGQVAASGASGDLGEQLEGALGGTEVGQAEAHIGRDDAHQGHVGDVVALGDLGADQDVEAALAEAAEDRFILATSAAGVAIEARSRTSR